MFLRLVLYAIILAGYMAVAQPTKQPGRNGTLAPTLWVNGERVSRYPAESTQLPFKSPCAMDDDLMECAKKIWHAYKVDPLMKVGKREAKVPCYWVPGGRDSWDGYITIRYDAELAACSLSDPMIISKQPTFYCNGGEREIPENIMRLYTMLTFRLACSQEFSFTHSHTETEQYGFSIGITATAGIDIGVVSTETTLSTSFDKEWIKTTTNTTTVERTIGMEPGAVCAATSIQMKLNCQSYVNPIDSTVDFFDNDDNFHGSFSIFDSRLQDTGAFGLEKVRNAIKKKIPTSFDVGSGGKDNKPWVIEGCMFN